jgi:hypothetical protein
LCKSSGTETGAIVDLASTEMLFLGFSWAGIGSWFLNWGTGDGDFSSFFDDPKNLLNIDFFAGRIGWAGVVVSCGGVVVSCGATIEMLCPRIETGRAVFCSILSGGTTELFSCILFFIFLKCVY